MKRKFKLTGYGTGKHIAGLPHILISFFKEFIDLSKFFWKLYRDRKNKSTDKKPLEN